MQNEKDIRTYSNNEDLIFEKRKQIVKAATKLFIRKGFLKTSTREIAQECGMGKGTLYHYIGKKEDVLGLLTDFGKSWVKDLEAIALRLDQLKVKERLATVIRTYLQFVDEHQDMLVFWYQETKNLKGEFRQRLFDVEQSMVKMYAQLLKDGCDSGDFKIKDVSMMATNIVILCDMWAFRRWDLRKSYTLSQYADVQIENILNSIWHPKEE
jgi:AcrR family transcriptional regulator